MRILLDERDIFTLICAMVAFRTAIQQFQCWKSRCWFYKRSTIQKGAGIPRSDSIQANYIL